MELGGSERLQSLRSEGRDEKQRRHVKRIGLVYHSWMKQNDKAKNDVCEGKGNALAAGPGLAT